MAKIYKSIEELIGRTPLMELSNLEQKLELQAKLIAKVEALNPGGSAKDRVAKRMVEDAEKAGILKAGATIIEPTSGNTGIGLAVMAAARGYRAIIVMPDSMSMERRLLMTAFGAELVLTEGAKGMSGAIAKAEELAKEIPNSFIPGQFDNPSNPAAHYETTGPEIWEDTDGKVDIFVAGIGTGGTITGTGRYLKEQDPNVKIIGVEPASSPLLTKGEAGPHGLQGIGVNFVPSILDTEIYDEVITVTDEAAYEAGRMIARNEGLLVGISAGAALHAAVEVAKRPENAGKNIVVLLPDTGDRWRRTCGVTRAASASGRLTRMRFRTIAERWARCNGLPRG
ncbi:MAG: cysteine synthase A, partial [Anaerotignum sp.]|nr:cysteine synthase A [Anaerotignum sp.]